MLDFPCMVDAELVGKLHLIERILKQLQLVAVFPGARQLMFVENTKAHDVSRFVFNY